MYRVIAVGLISALIGVLAGAVLVVKLSEQPKAPPALAMVDLVGIVERLRAGALKETADPEKAERAIAGRMDRLAHLLSEVGQDRVILNKRAVVSGKLPDITGQVEERLKDLGGQ